MTKKEFDLLGRLIIKHSLIEADSVEELMCYFPGEFCSWFKVAGKMNDDLELAKKMCYAFIPLKRQYAIKSVELYMLDCVASSPCVSQESAKKHWQRLVNLKGM